MAPRSVQKYRILQFVSQASESLLSGVIVIAAAVRWVLRHKRCRTCRRRICAHVIEMSICMVEEFCRRSSRNYMNSTHLNNVDTRFDTFEGYLRDRDETMFHEYTRFTIDEFHWLYHRLRDRLTHREFHKFPIHAKHRLLICLRYLGHGRTFHSLGHEFKIGKSTAVSIVYEVCRAIRAELWDEACAKPTRADWAESAAGFQALWGYPRAIGAIDGKHFQCVAPPRSGSSYYNYKGTFSVVLLIVVDSHYRILLIDCGGKGKVSDSGLFRTSPIKTFLENSRELFPPAAPLGNDGIVEFHILADGGFPQFTWMQRPYQQGEAFQDIRKAHFNMCFSSARRIVENVFGIICSRFRVFQAPLYGSPEHVKLIVLTACTLHNLLAKRISGEELAARYPRIDMFSTTEGGNVPRIASRMHTGDDAHLQRQRLTNFFADRDGLRL